MIKRIMKGLLAVCCALTMVSIQGVYAAEGEPVIIDDTDERFVYSEGDANHGGWGSADGSDPAASEHWSNTPGATLEISFEGNVLEIYGIKAPNHLMFTVSIDGGEAVECDGYGPSRTDGNQLLYSSEDAGIELENTAHTALLTVLDQSNEAAVNAQGISITYAKVYGGEVSEPEEPEFPGYSDVDDATSTSSGELFKIQYEPAAEWNAESGYPNLFLNGTDHYSTSGEGSEGQYYTMKFIGTGIEIYASKNTAHADFDVYIDDEFAGTGEANLESGNTQHQQLLFKAEGLENTTHTLRVEKTPGDTATKAMQIDMIRVYHEEMAPTSITLDRSEVTMIPGGSTTLNASVEPWVATNDDIIWTSSNDAVVSVEDGVLTAAEVETKETVIITAMAAADESVYVQATITVDPSLAVMNAYVGNEKLLDIAEDYDELAVGNDPTYEGTAWRGDQLNSKVVVATMGRDVTNVQVTASDFTNEQGAVLSADNFDIKWLKEIDANIGRGNSSAPVKEFPDMIYKGGAKDIAANDVQFAWIKINVPEDTQAGTYTGTITVSADELSEPFVLRYTIEVIDLVQPEAGATDIQIWQHPFSVANYYLGLGSQPSGGISNDLAEDFYFTEEHFNLMRASMEEYVEMGGHDAVANIVEEAWNHQSYYSDPSMVKWTKKADGSWEFDYTWYDAWIEFMIECGVLDPENGIGQIKCYSIVPWNNQIAYYDEASGETVKESHSPGSDSWKAMWEPFLEDFIQHSKEKGWFEITYISMDERGLSELEPAVEMIESVTDEEGNHFKISSALNYAAPEYYDFTDRIDDISINLGNASNVQQMKDLSEHRRELGLNTTFYTCTGDYPSNFTISDPGDNYWDVWYTMTLGTDGYMRWAWDNFVYDMHGDITYRYWEPGDGWFFYPLEREEADMSETVGFYSTPRYELFKQGVRDVAKAKYLLESEEVSEEQKEELRSVVENLSRPSGTTSYGSRVPANEEQRMLVHSETERALEATNALAREVAGSASEEEPASEAALQALQAMVEKAVALGSDDAVLQAAIETAQALLADAENATSTAVVSALLNLSEAMADLNTGGSSDKLREDLKATIDYINAYVLTNVDNVRPAKVTELKTAVAEAYQVYMNEDATADEIRTAIRTLSEKAQELWLIVSKAELNALIESAEAISADGYTDLTYRALQAAITAAKSAAANDNATTSEVTQAITDLASAIAGLETITLDTSALEHEIELAEAILANIDDYVPSTVEGLQEKVDAAKAALSAATQEEIDAATKTLREARLTARTKADVSALEEIIAYANSLDLSGYSRASVLALNQTIAQSKLLFGDEEVSQETVNAAVEDIQNAIDALEPASVTTPDNGNSGTTAGSTNTAVATQTGMMLALLAAAGAAAAIAYRRKRS